VYFYVLDPQSLVDGSPRMVRIRKKFAHIKSKKLRDEAALRFRDEVARKLREGWNPLIESSNSKSFTLFDNVIATYKRYMKKELKDDVIKAKTFVDYSSRLTQLENWNRGLSSKTVYAYQFDRSFVEAFLEYIYIDRDTTPRTRNNYLRWIRSFCSYLFDHGYLTKNVAEHITFLREDEKKRKPLTRGDLRKLHDYLINDNPYFLVACLMHYYTLVRPGELTGIRLQDIDVAQQTMYVSHEISKNRKDAYVTIPAKVLTMMKALRYFDSPGALYLFGRDFRPSLKKSDSRIFRECWVEVRKALGWPDTYQFYSLKDTGITDAIDSVGLTVTKDQARHASVQTTNRYVRKEQHSAHPEFKDYDGNL
jgi:integrase